MKHFPRLIAALAAIIPGMKATEAVALDEALALDVFPKKTADDEYPDLSANDKKAALDAYSAKSGKALDAMSDEDKREAFKAAKDAKATPAMDEGILTTNVVLRGLVDKRVAEAVTAAVKDMVPKAEATKLAQDSAAGAALDAETRVHALYAARHAVEPSVGVCTLDSAETVYRFALDHLKVDHKDTPAPALAALYDASAKAVAAPAIATDTAPSGKFDPKILGLSHIRKG